jgi:hypothetical protein
MVSALVKPGREVVIYVADGRELEAGPGQPCSGELAFSLTDGSYEVRLYHPASGTYDSESLAITGGEVVLPVQPFTHDVVVHVTRRSPA